MRTRNLVGLIATAGAAAAVVLAPVASADPDEVSNQPACTTTGIGGTFTGSTTTECSTPGNVQIAEAAPAPDYMYPWDDDFYGAPLLIGGGNIGPHGGGGGGGHR